VTVLFADVVHSMDIAAAIGAERLREIMTDLADRCAAVVERYGGTVDYPCACLSAAGQSTW
jgi:adenylate cyclase